MTDKHNNYGGGNSSAELYAGGFLADKIMKKISFNHAIALSLNFLYNKINHDSFIIKKITSIINRSHEKIICLRQDIFHEIRKIDDKVECPYCHKQMSLIDFEVLKTYCYDCSNWGHDPRENIASDYDYAYKD
jgi:hypothetical protein